jgi:uncharacterized damage-inducible protein DinB
MSNREIDDFLSLWEYESGVTLQLLKTVPADRFGFRPDPEGRSIGELAWHLAALEGIMSNLAVQRNFAAAKPAGLEQPPTMAEVVSGYERMHREAVARVRSLSPEDLDREFDFFDRPISVRQVLRVPLLHHLIHHRGQLMMMIRMAHAVPSRVYGPLREESPPVGEQAKT